MADDLNPEQPEKDELTPIPEEDLDLLLGLVEQMAGFLWEPARFDKSVRQRWATLPEPWPNLLQMLPKESVLARGSDAEWSWLYDFAGNPLRQQEETKARILESITEIRQIEHAVQAYTDGRLNLDRLALELHVLELSPLYSSFEMAAGNYQANSGFGEDEQTYPSLPTDKLILRQYSDMLARCWWNLQFTFYLSATVAAYGATSTVSTRSRTEALRIVAEMLDFDRVPTVQLGQELLDFYQDLGELRRTSFDGMVSGQPAAEWFQTLSRFTPQFPPPQTTEALSSAYYLGRMRAMVRHLRDGKPLARPSLVELYARFRTQVPSFHGNPNEMPLCMYAWALYRAMATEGTAGDAIDLFLVSCLIKLGFGQQALVIYQRTGSANDDETDLLEEAGRAPVRKERVLLVLGKAKPPQSGAISLAENWFISQQHAVFPAYLDIEWDDLGKLNFTLVLFEEGLREQAEEMRKKGVFVPAVPAVEIATSRQDRKGLFITQPPTLDDAVALARQLMNPSTLS
jgi:hypothetical protein